MKTNALVWLNAFRLRTLPLALSCILVGSFSANYQNEFSVTIFTLAALTTVFLQILSNLANDFGDAQKGLDNIDRIGPKRTVSSGLISNKQMVKAIVLFAILSFVTGIWLLVKSLGTQNLYLFLVFLLLGLLSIWAAIKYTIGKKPYGYKALGDLFVFVFFGVVGVSGSYYLQTKTFNISILLNAAGIGFLSAAVLNMNNLRDRLADMKNGKITLAVKLGETKTKLYQTILIFGALICFGIFTTIHFQSIWQFAPFIFFGFLFLNVFKVWKNTNPALLDAELKRIALSTFAFSVTFAATSVIQ